MSKGTSFKGIRVRLYPTKEQAILLSKNVGCARFVFNHMLGLRKEAYEKEKKSIHKNELIKLLVELKKEKDYEWLKEVDAQSLQQAVINMDTAYQNFFKHNFGFPKFKKKSHTGSFRCQQGNNGTNLRVKSNSIKIGKHGFVKFRCSTKDRELLAASVIKSITVSKEAGLYFASCLVEVPEPAYKGHPLSKVGIDLGVKKPLAIAYQKTLKKKDGTKNILRFKTWGIHYSQLLAKKERHRKKLQKAYSRKQKGSKNQEKARLKVARAFLKERNLRKEFVEKISHVLTLNFSVINFENLNIKGMTRSAKGTVQKPGKNVRAKSGLNREMTRLGLGMLVLRTEQKAMERGSYVNFVDPRNTSRKCSKCSHIHKENRKNQAEFKCKACGYTKNADYNAAKNILRAA